MSELGSKIVVALDYSNFEECMCLVNQLDAQKCRLKVGKEMFTLFGPDIVDQIQKKGFDVFLDLKFHDIPNTVAKAVSAAAKLGVWMVNVHASGGSRMMQAAMESLDKHKEKPLLIAVTVLTSMERNDLSGIGLDLDPLEQVKRLARLADDSGLDGVVSSAHEANLIKSICGDKFITVTPGIRPSSAEGDDQRRVMTPSRAIENGSDYLVIGRPITKADSPIDALDAMYDEVYNR